MFEDFDIRRIYHLPWNHRGAHAPITSNHLHHSFYKAQIYLNFLSINCVFFWEESFENKKRIFTAQECSAPNISSLEHYNICLMICLSKSVRISNVRNGGFYGHSVTASAFLLYGLFIRLWRTKRLALGEPWRQLSSYEYKFPFYNLPLSTIFETIGRLTNSELIRNVTWITICPTTE